MKQFDSETKRTLLKEWWEGLGRGSTINQIEIYKKYAANWYGVVSINDLEWAEDGFGVYSRFITEKGGWRPKDGAKNMNGDVWDSKLGFVVINTVDGKEIGRYYNFDNHAIDIEDYHESKAKSIQEYIQNLDIQKENTRKEMSAYIRASITAKRGEPQEYRETAKQIEDAYRAAYGLDPLDYEDI